MYLHTHNYFEEEIKNAVFFAQFTHVSKSYVLLRPWKIDHATVWDDVSIVVTWDDTNTNK